VGQGLREAPSTATHIDNQLRRKRNVRGQKIEPLPHYRARVAARGIISGGEGRLVVVHRAQAFSSSGRSGPSTAPDPETYDVSIYRAYIARIVDAPKLCASQCGALPKSSLVKSLHCSGFQTLRVRSLAAGA